MTRSPAPKRPLQDQVRRLGRQRRLQRRGVGRLRRALGGGGLRAGRQEPDRHRARRRGHLLTRRQSFPAAATSATPPRSPADFTPDEAKELAALIEGGALPLPLESISDRLVGPTLGDQAIEDSFEAGLIGLILTGLFITIVYRFVGFLATIALASYALIAYAMLLALGATLTLPGLAGFVLAIGLAIDANVLVFERAREEYVDAPKAGLSAALTNGLQQGVDAPSSTPT